MEREKNKINKRLCPKKTVHMEDTPVKNIKLEKISPQKKMKISSNKEGDGDGGSKVKKEKKTPVKRKNTKIKTENEQNEDTDNIDGGVSSKKKIKTEDKKPAVKKNLKAKTEGVSGVSWDLTDVIAVRVDVPNWAANNVIKLLDEGCTIPFIARYRKEQTGQMEVPKLRDVCTLVEELRTIEHKVKTVKVEVTNQGKMTSDLDKAFSNAQTLTEVECLFAPFKPGQKGSLAQRAKTLGLEPMAKDVVDGRCEEKVAYQHINPDEKGLATLDDVLEGVKHIIADMIHKDTKVMEETRTISHHQQIMIQTKKAKETKAKENKPLNKKTVSAHKFEDYFDRSFFMKNLQSHQVLAINRGESNKILSVKVVLPDSVAKHMEMICRSRWLRYGMPFHCIKLIERSIHDAYSRMIEPQICRLVRSRLTKDAEKAAIEVFAKNLKCLLLTSPVKGCTILAVDPGFSNGCKCAVISKTGEILATEIAYLHTSKNSFAGRNVLSKLIRNYKCDVVAIGNGVACRETENTVANLIQESFPKIKYCIISESGVSIYSVSDAAQAEMPELDPSLRGAVSLGRRLLDPLAEYVKVDPKHLGIGQYQHDMPQSQLKASLDSNIEECVSFVGVDVNTCSQCLLSHVSGLSATRAKNIIEFRTKFGPFICREQIKSVKGLGEKTYEQAAGFIRIHKDVKNIPCSPVPVKPQSPETKLETVKGKGRGKKKVIEYQSNPLDMTWIHPESYGITHRLLDEIDVSLSKMGEPGFISKVKSYLSTHSLEAISRQLDCGLPTVKLITEALSRPLSYDLRDEFDKPLFRDSVKSIQNLKSGESVTGRVMNVTSFGAFVDIGVGVNGLIHVSKMYSLSERKKYDLSLGEKVQATIISIDTDKKRIGLKLDKVL